MKVWIVSLEWNQPPSEVTGDTGLCGVYDNEAAAREAQLAEQRHYDSIDGDGVGITVWQFSMVAGRYCIACGELDIQDGKKHDCRNIAPEDAEEFCDHCGAELNDRNSCDNDHDEWDIDVHCTEHEVRTEVLRG